MKKSKFLNVLGNTINNNLNNSNINKTAPDKSLNKLSIIKNIDNVSSILKNPLQIKKSNVMESISEKSDFNIKDDFEENRTNKLVDKIIISKGKNPKKQKKSIEKIIGLEDRKNEINLINKLDGIDKNLTSLTFTSGAENQDYGLVEKSYIDNLRKENEDLSSQIKNLIESNRELKVTFRKTAGEALFLKDMNESQDKLKCANTRKIKQLTDEIAELENIEKQLKEILTKEKLEKDNLYRALITFTKQFDANLASELDLIYKNFNNQFFLASRNPIDQKIVEDLFGEISLLEKEIKKKDAEIVSLNKLIPDKRRGTLGASSSSFNSKLPILQSKDSFKSNPNFNPTDAKKK